MSNKNTVIQILKFGAVGVSNTFISLVMIFTLMKYFNLSYTVSNAGGYLVAVVNSFIWNKKWTFNSQGDTNKEIFRFILIFFVCYFIQLIVLVLLKEKIGILPDIAQLLAMVVYIASNFWGNKFFTFNQR